MTEPTVADEPAEKLAVVPGLVAYLAGEPVGPRRLVMRIDFGPLR